LLSLKLKLIDCWVQSVLVDFDCTQQSKAPYDEMIAECNQIPPFLIAPSNRLEDARKSGGFSYKYRGLRSAVVFATGEGARRGHHLLIAILFAVFVRAIADVLNGRFT
jgi:hypothetical protein